MPPIDGSPPKRFTYEEVTAVLEVWRLLLRVYQLNNQLDDDSDNGHQQCQRRKNNRNDFKSRHPRHPLCYRLPPKRSSMETEGFQSPSGKRAETAYRVMMAPWRTEVRYREYNTLLEKINILYQKRKNPHP